MHVAPKFRQPYPEFRLQTYPVAVQCTLATSNVLSSIALVTNVLKLRRLQRRSSQLRDRLLCGTTNSCTFTYTSSARLMACWCR